MELHQSVVSKEFTSCLSSFPCVILLKSHIQILNHMDFMFPIRQRRCLARSLSPPFRDLAERVRDGSITDTGIVLESNH